MLQRFVDLQLIAKPITLAEILHYYAFNLAQMDHFHINLLWSNFVLINAQNRLEALIIMEIIRLA